MTTGKTAERRALMLTVVLAGCLGHGCAATRHVGRVRVENRSLGPMTLAVAPALNVSGSADFDPNRFADAMAVELGYVDGVSVIPVSRVLGVLAGLGQENVESQSKAIELARLLGVDAILVFAVTDYDPYDPPSIGIAAQLFGARPGPGRSALDPVRLSRQTSLTAPTPGSIRRGLLAQTQQVFDAAHGAIAEDIRAFASQRDANRSPYGWRKFVVSQQHFIKYCCHATVRELFRRVDEPESMDTTRR